MKVKLHEIAHSRAGDKGDTSNISLIVYDLANFPIIQQQVTSKMVAEWFSEMVAGPVERYELPQLGALNFVMRGALGGGVTRSLSLDPHGKSRSSLLLEMEVEVPAASKAKAGSR